MSSLMAAADRISRQPIRVDIVRLVSKANMIVLSLRVQVLGLDSATSSTFLHVVHMYSGEIEARAPAKEALVIVPA
jgi:hypothetical protein